MQCTSSPETITQENVYYNGVSHHSLGSAGAITLSLPVAHDHGPAMAAVRGPRLTSETLSVHNRTQQVRSYFFHVDARCISMLLSIKECTIIFVYITHFPCKGHVSNEAEEQYQYIYVPSSVSLNMHHHSCIITNSSRIYVDCNCRVSEGTLLLFMAQWKRKASISL